MSRILQAVGTAFVALLLVAGQLHAATPTATIDLPGKPKWHQVTSLGLVLVGTDEALMLINGDTGQVQWKRDDIKKTLLFNVREVEGSSIILVNDWSGAIGAKVSAQGLDFATGQTVFRVEPEQGMNLGLYPAPDGTRALIIAQMYTGQQGTFATLYEVPTGKQLWRTRIGGMNDIITHPSDRGGMFNTKLDLSGHQPPLFDGDTVYLPFLGLMALDMTSGAIKWNVEYATAPREYKKAYSAPVIDGDTIFASGKGEVYAIDKASGAVRWKSDKVASGFFKSGIMAQVLPTADSVYVRLGGNFYNTGTREYELKKPLGVMALDRATGERKWMYKDADDGMTNLLFLPNEAAVMMADGDHLSGLDVAAKDKGKAKFEVPIEFKRKMSGGEMAAAGVSAVSGLLTGGLAGAMKGGFGAADGKKRLDVPVALLPRKDGKIVVAGKQHLMCFDPAAKKIDWSIYYPAPGSSGVGLAVMSTLTLAASVGSFANQAYSGVSSYSSSAQQTFGSLNDYATKRYEASQQAREYSYVLTTVTEGSESGVGLMAINLDSGEPGAQILLKDKEPEYEVDELEGRLYYFNDKKQVMIYAMK